MYMKVTWNDGCAIGLNSLKLLSAFGTQRCAISYLSGREWTNQHSKLAFFGSPEMNVNSHEPYEIPRFVR